MTTNNAASRTCRAHRPMMPTNRSLRIRKPPGRQPARRPAIRARLLSRDGLSATRSGAEAPPEVRLKADTSTVVAGRSRPGSAGRPTLLRGLDLVPHLHVLRVVGAQIADDLALRADRGVHEDGGVV